jgi:hypothetical protein
VVWVYARSLLASPKKIEVSATGLIVQRLSVIPVKERKERDGKMKWKNETQTSRGQKPSIMQKNKKSLISRTDKLLLQR